MADGAPTKRLGVVLLAYGSPENLNDMGDFLTDIRGGRAIPEAAVAVFRKRYEETGGPSPLNRLTRDQADALGKQLKALGCEVATYVGMAHCPPRIAQAVDEAHRAGIQHLVGFPMAPHFSTLSTGKYHRLFREACERDFPAAKHSVIDAFYDEPELVAFHVREIQKVLEKESGVAVLFSAHSLPERILKDKDPYPEQFQQNAKAIAAKLGLAPTQWKTAYQSRGIGEEPWLGPSLEEVIAAQSQTGWKQVVICPIGFVCDHIEILYDLDIDLRRKAKALGVEILRTPLPNTDPLFITALAKRFLRHLNQLEGFATHGR